ncbi:putative adaptor protein enigma [Operophtera brumata]|uniref:Putative adaptor protein enigma n=1 Tax=Operophtera brumata TaxID=104452 RepID=A0A0L7KTA4_OPEBR|nr:putative adaptor protein enigma [Operophtera brumata]
MAQLLTVRLSKSDQQPLGFRLQGGKDFGTPLVVQKVSSELGLAGGNWSSFTNRSLQKQRIKINSCRSRTLIHAGDALIRVNTTDVFTLRHQEAQDAIRAAGGALELTYAGLQAGDALIQVNTTDVFTLRHQEAQDAIRAAGGALELTVQRLPRPGSRPLGASPTPVTNTSLKATQQQSRAFGSGHNNIAKPFGYMNGNDSVKSIVNKQYNTPVNIYSDKTIAETLSAQTEVLAGGVLGVNFKKNEKTYDAEKSAVFKVLQEEASDPEPVSEHVSSGNPAPPAPVTGLRHVQAPITRPDAPLNNTGGLPVGQNICEECERLITGVFVRIKDKNLHVECFKCSTCGSSLKNQGYYNLNGKLYCDIHAKLVARQNPPASNLEPVTVPPGGRVPSNTYSTPLPPISTNNYSNGSSALFSPSSNLSGPKPFGSSIGSAYSPSLSPRSAPMSPARPVTAPTAAPTPAYAPAPTSAYAPVTTPAYAPAPTYAPAPVPAAPFAPSQTVKSIVWPPPNPLEDEPLKRELSPQSTIAKHRQESVPQIVNNINNDSTQIATLQDTKKHIASSQQQKDFSSNVSSTSTALSSVTASSAKTETIMQSHQSQIVQATSSCTVQSFSQESSLASQNMSIFQSGSNPIQFQQSFNDSELNTSFLDTESKEIKQCDSVIEKPIQNQAIQMKSKVNKPGKDCINEELIKSVNDLSLSPEQNKIMTQEKDNAVEDLQQIQQSNTAGEKVFAKDKKYTGIEDNTNITSTESIFQIANTLSQFNDFSMVDALTTAPDRPYSPLPAPRAPINTPPVNVEISKSTEMELAPPQPSQEPPKALQAPPQPAPLYMQPKRGVSPIPPIKAYNPPGKPEVSIPMPPETKPYIPADFKIIIEPKAPRDMTNSPMVDALTTAPNRPFTPVNAFTEPVERGSLIDALTIAPDRPFSPLPFHMSGQSSQQYSQSSNTSSVQLRSTSSEVVRPIVTQTTQTSTQNHSELTSTQSMRQFQSSSDTSAFKPVARQVFPSPQSEEFCKLTNFPPLSEELKSSFAKQTTTKQEPSVTESSIMMQSNTSTSHLCKQGYSSVKTAQNFFEQLDQKETMSSTSVRSTSGLHKPDSIPTYQKNFEMLPSQRGITPELCNAPAVLQRPVTPTTNPPCKPRDKSQETPKIIKPPEDAPYRVPQVMTPVQKIQQIPVQFHKDTPISMTFQPVTDESYLRASPSRSRPSTPSMINKPAPIIPHYQMNLVTVEHLAPESHLLEPSSPEVSRSPTPKLRSRSPAQGPPPNPLKAQAPRIQEGTPQRNVVHTLLNQATSNLRKEHEMAQFENQTNANVYNTSGAKSWAQDQPSVIKEQKFSNTGYKSENYGTGEIKVKVDSLNQQSYAQKEMQSRNVAEYGNTKVQTTRKTYEEFERTQTAKVIQIRKGGSSTPSTYQQIESNIRPSNVNPKQIFPPPVMSFSSSQNSSVNITNENIATTSRPVEDYQTKPSISGANHGPVCDPTPSTGSSVGAAARGKAFGVSSAPKRGRGVLNKAAVPGSRVPLCGSCNGNIRCKLLTTSLINAYILCVYLNVFDFLTVNETQPTGSLHKPEFKSPAEERLIRKMAKMALNGYEIGIQRKIKPGDHIQTMADKIQDTIVTKHPLNADNVSSGENSRDSTLRRPINTNIDKVYKAPDPSIISIGDKIKETIMINHPATTMNGNTSLASSPPPPPIPCSPIPTLNVHSTPKKQCDFISKNNIISNINNFDKSHNGSDYSSSEDSNKDKSETNYSDTLTKSKDLEKSSFLNVMNNSTNDTKLSEAKFKTNFSNTLNKRKIFERDAPKNTYSSSDNRSKIDDKFNNMHDTLRKRNSFEISKDQIINTALNQNDDQLSKKVQANNLQDNTLYTYKPTTTEINDQSNTNLYSDTINSKDTKDDVNEEHNDENTDEVVVKRRQKKCSRNDDGRRDSHIITRPLSTMTAADVADGLYPVCHKCDKAIKRGPFITALGRIWCPEHFICVNATCRRPLQDIGFVEENGQLYCEYCFEQYIAPACDKCHAKIKGDCLNAIGKHFHPECFSCVYCSKLFGNNPFFLEDGLPYCEADWNELFTTKCFACGFPVEAGDRCAKRTSKDRVSSPKEVDHFVRLTPARSPQIIYNSDTVYSTTTFRPVSPSPITPPAPNTPSPQRTRKLETPLHFDGGLFSDIRSTEGKLLSKVTVDRVQSSTQHDITDSPSIVRTQDSKNYIDDMTKTETITNKDVITVKFTPVPPELDSPWLLTPSQFIQLQSQSPLEYFKDNYEDLQSLGHDIMKTETKTNKDVNTAKFTPVPPELDSPRLLTPSQFIKMQSQSPIEYIKDNYEDLQSYKIVNSLCKEKVLETDIMTSDRHKTEKTVTFNVRNGQEDSFFHEDVADYDVQHDGLKETERLYVADELDKRGHSPLANIILSEQLTKLDNYLQESLDVCLGRKGTPMETLNDMREEPFVNKQTINHKFEEKSCHIETSTYVVNNSDTNMENSSYHTEEPIFKTPERVQTGSIKRDGTNDDEFKTKEIYKLNSVPKRKTGILNTIYNMPIHYHAAILCVILIIYNLIYQYIKSQGKNKM